MAGDAFPFRGGPHGLRGGRGLSGLGQACRSDELSLPPRYVYSAQSTGTAVAAPARSVDENSTCAAAGAAQRGAVRHSEAWCVAAKCGAVRGGADLCGEIGEEAARE
jgi:hypothetical protein